MQTWIEPLGWMLVHSVWLISLVDPKVASPHKPYQISLPDGLATYAIAWNRGAGVLWIADSGIVRNYDFSDPAQVKETRFEPGSIVDVPEQFRNMLTAAFEVPSAPVEKQESRKPIDGEKLDHDSEAKLKWGEAVNGLRGAIAIRHSAETPEEGDKPDIYLALQNVSQAPIRVTDTDVPKDINLRILYPRKEGRIMAGLGTREPALGDVTLQPREVTFLPFFDPDTKITVPEDSTLDGRTLGASFSEDVLNDARQSLSAELQIDQAPAGAWTGKIVTQEIATPEDAMWLGHAQHLQGRLKDAAASYLLILTLADQRIVALEKQTEPNAEQRALEDHVREFGGPTQDWKRDRDRELQRFAELWPQWVLLAGQVQLRDVGDAAGAAKTLARGLRFVPEAESMETLLKDAQQAVATKPQPISEQTRWRTWLYPMATQRSLAMAYERLGDHTAAARCWCRFQLSWLAYQVGMANAKAEVIEAAIARVPNDQREPFHEFVLKHPGRKKAGPREFDIPQRLKTDPQNPFEIRSRLDGFEMMNNGPSQPSVMKLKNGSWLMAFTSGDPFQARVMFARSDDGKIWSKPYEFAHNGIFPTRSPAVIEDDDGTLWLLCSSQRLDPNRYSSGGYQWWLCSSKDGRTWSTLKPLTFSDGRPFGGSYQHTAQLTRDHIGKFWIVSNEFAGSTDRLSEPPRMQPLVLGLGKDEHITSSFATFDAENRCHLALTTLTELSLTSSSDMQTWQPRQVLQRPEKNRGLDRPRLLVDGDRFVLFYETGWGQFRSGLIEPVPDGGAAKITLSKPVSLDLEVSGSLITQDGDDVLLIANQGYENSPPVLLSAKRTALLAMADASATKDTDPQVNEADRETLRRLVRGGKIDGNSLQAMIARVAESGTNDVEFARLVLVEFEKGCAAEPGTNRLNRDLLAVIAELFESWATPNWRTQLARLNPNAANDHVPATRLHSEQMDKLEAEMLTSLIRNAYNADRSNIAGFTLAARQLHHRDSRDFLRDVLRNPENNDTYALTNPIAPANETKTTPSPLPQTNQKPGAVIKSKWKDSIGGGWGDAKFIAAVGLAELNDAEGVEWLLSMARDNDFGIDGSLWQHPHVRDPRGSLRASCRLSLADLFGQRAEPSFEQLTNWWRDQKPQFIARPVALMLGVNRPQKVVGDDDASIPDSLLPNGKEAQSLFKKWQGGSRANGNIPGGAIGPLVRVMTTFVKNNPTHEASPKFVELLKRIDVARDWSREEAVKLLNEVTAIYPSLPEWVQGEVRFTLGGDIETGSPLPDELTNAPWGESQPNGLRVACLLEPRALKYRLGTPLKSVILFHNSGKDSVVFRALTFNQSGSHKARDANGAEINIVSTSWTTIPRVVACRLAPDEFIEMTAAGIGVGAIKDEEDWRGTRVGSWIEAKAGNVVTFIPAPVSADGRDPEEQAVDAPPNQPQGTLMKWWLEFITDRLSLDLPLPADAVERGRILDRATRDLFGNKPTDEEVSAFTTDASPDALDRLTKRLAQRPGFTPFSGSLTSGTRKFLVLPADPDAATKPRTATGPGRYTLGEQIRFVVTRRPVGERIANEASIEFYATDSKIDPPGKPHEVKLPDGYDTWSAAWLRGGTVLWVKQKGFIRSYDFSNPAQVKETAIEDPTHGDNIPQAIRDSLHAALDLPGAPKQTLDVDQKQGVQPPAISGVILSITPNRKWVESCLGVDGDVATGDAVILVEETPLNEVGATSPPKGLEFLKPYPKLHGLSLDMSESQFRRLAARDKLSLQMSPRENDDAKYSIPTGDEHTVLVMFRIGKCSGIQRIQGEGRPEKVSFESLSVTIKTPLGRRPSEQIQINGDGSCVYHIDEQPARGDELKHPEARLTSKISDQRMLELERMLAQTDWLNAAADKDGPPQLHADEITITLVRDKQTKAITCLGTRTEPYHSLLWFLRGIAEEEHLVYVFDWLHGSDTTRKLALISLRFDVEALSGKSGRAMPNLELDYNRFLPTFSRMIRNPSTVEDEVLTAIKLVTFVGADSELEWISRLKHDRESNIRNAVAESLADFGGERVVAMLVEMAPTTDEARWGLIRLGEFAVPSILKLIEPGSTPTDIVSEQMVRAFLDHRNELPGPIDDRIVTAAQQALAKTAEQQGRTTYFKEFLSLATELAEKNATSAD